MSRLAWLRTGIAGAIAADNRLAEVSVRDRDAGIHDETPEFAAANDAAYDSFYALPWWARCYVVWKADPYWGELGWWNEPQDAV